MLDRETLEARRDEYIQERQRLERQLDEIAAALMRYEGGIVAINQLLAEVDERDSGSG